MPKTTSECATTYPQCEPLGFVLGQPDEHTNLRLRFGSWSCLAEAMDVSQATLATAATGRGRGSPGLALRAARAAGSTVEAILEGKITPANACPHCGARGAERGRP